MTSADGQRWWFDSGSVALDFAYTGGFGSGWESLLDSEALTDWLRERFATVEGTATDVDLTDARALRKAIARIARSIASGVEVMADDIDMLNVFAATPDIPPALAGGVRRAGRATARTGQALSAMAREAIEMFAAGSEHRIRECAADDCQLVFRDESRSNNRRWCSMQRCGNRAKVRAHRERVATPVGRGLREN
jgi:predicted RNA-binding Zn ribbon-like protein